MKEKQFYNLSNDYLFKLIFSNKKYLKQFLKDCFNIEVGDFHYTKENLTNSNKNVPAGEFDIIIETEKEFIIVEMQNKGFKSFENRVMMYAARKYSDGLKKIQKEQKKTPYEIYNDVKPITSCWVLNFNYTKKELLKFKMLEEKCHIEFGNTIKVLLLNLKAKHQTQKIRDYELLGNAKNLEELEKLRKKKKFKDMIKDIEYYNMDEKTYKEMEESRRMRERFEEDIIIASADAYREGKDVGRNEGRSEGRSEGIKIGKTEEKLKIAKYNIPISMDN